MATSAADDRTRPGPADLQDEIRHLRRALATRPTIDQAKGILMAQHGCTADEAFAMLAAASQRTNRKVSDIAAGMIHNTVGGPRPGPPAPRPDTRPRAEPRAASAAPGSLREVP